jgi:putative toxin-antitoxin system antitoxin component (TIGR02293 family)
MDATKNGEPDNSRLHGVANWRNNNSQEASMETEAIVETLGGRKILGKAVKNSDDLKHIIRRGLPASSITALAGKLHIGNSVLSRKLGIPQRTLTRRLSQALPLTPAESDRTVRMARVYVNAVEMIGDEEKAIEWLNTPNRALGGERPLDQLDTDTGARVVEDILGRIAYGVYS